MFARHLDKAAVAGVRTTVCADRAIELSGVVRPYGDIATIAGRHRIRIDIRVLRDVGLRSVLLGTCTMKIATHQDRSTAGIARRIDPRAAEEADLVAEHLDRAASR